jgi:DNA mismatch repair protein MutS2
MFAPPTSPSQASPAHASAAALPDLLNASPFCTLDTEKVDMNLVFAFAGSTSGGLFVDALSTARLAPSTWLASAFEQDLFVNDFVRSCFQAEITGQPTPLITAHIKRVLTAPPLDANTVAFRRDILGELVNDPSQREGLERVYRQLSRFRGLLEGTQARGIWDQNRRQLDLLRLFHELVTTLDGSFAHATSGLRRLHTFGQHIAQSEAYQSLVQLLRYDAELATVTFRLGVGADGRVRQLDLVSVEENASNPFVVSPWRRWLQRAELLFRGYPLREGEVMARFLDAVFEGIRPHLVPFVQLFGDLEFYLGALGFWSRATRSGLHMCFPEFVPPSEPRELRGLFNPLLLGNGVVPVPCDVLTERHDVTLMITGPNSGGKTRLLQAIGLAQLLAQSGLFVPARSARMALAPGLVVSLLQETRVDQTEGRLGVELMRIRSLFESLPAGAVVLLDELCSGTNPSEGEEIVELVIRTLTRLHPQAYITTHFLEFAARLERQNTIADLRFLQVVLGPNQNPTYQFAPGVAQTSLAGVAAARLGVTGEQLMALVNRKLGPAADGPPRA